MARCTAACRLSVMALMVVSMNSYLCRGQRELLGGIRLRVG
jgi:hypothetical protein